MRGRRERQGPIDVLVVCTGNVCRSPYIAARLRSALPHLTVTSAGTNAAPRIPPPEPIIALLAEHGIEDPRLRSQPITRRQVRAASLVVTAEWMHSVQVAQFTSAAGERTFTLCQLARLLATDPTPCDAPDDTGVDAVLRRARSARGSAVPREIADDLADPYGGSSAGYARMTEDADAALRVLIPALGGAVADPAPVPDVSSRLETGAVPLRPWTR